MSHAPDPITDTAKCCALRLAALPDVMSCLKVNVRDSVLPRDRGSAPSVGLPVALSVPEPSPRTSVLWTLIVWGPAVTRLPPTDL